MIAKIFDQKKIFHDLIKKEVKIKFENYEIHDQILYIEKRLYISNNSKLKTKIIKDIHKFLSKKYAGKFFIYDKISIYYY